MPRQRTSTEPPKERAKLRTTEEINLEIRKLYRRFANKQLSAADLKSRVAALTALRSGMAAPIEQPDPAADFRPGIEQFSIVGIPRDWCVVGLFGREAHMPSETVQRLREMLPGAIGSPPSLEIRCHRPSTTCRGPPHRPSCACTTAPSQSRQRRPDQRAAVDPDICKGDRAGASAGALYQPKV